MLVPQNELRKFYSNKLSNNIKYTLIEDKNIEDTTVNVSIKVGYFSEPKNYNGLAHFLEHMLFLGSKKYPIENYFDSKLKSYGGFSNAYTSLFETVYYFNVLSKHFEEILDIFSRFFIDPLFDKKSVEREINAIDSEHLKNINNDGWILRYFLGIISDKNSPVNKFSTGNLKTLDKPEIRNVMQNFYNDYYCSDNMTISIISNLDLKTQKSILKNIFNNIKSNKSKKIVYPIKPYYSTKNNLYTIIPINNTKEIIYYWEIPLFNEYLKNKVWDIISDVIEGDELTNIKYFLKEQKLIQNFSCRINDFGLFIITIKIDINKNIINTMNEINKYLRYYLENLNKLNWKKIYDYHITKRKVYFKFLDRLNDNTLVDLIADNMHYYDTTYLYASSLVIDKNYEYLKKSLELLYFKNVNIILKYKDNNIPDMIQDEFYNFKHKKIIKSNNYFTIPVKKFNFNIQYKNEYLNINPKIDKTINIKHPILIKKNIWYGGLSKFNQPRVKTIIIYNSNNFFSSPLNYLLNSISIQIINYYLSLKFNNISQLGYFVYFSINITYSTINLNISGLTDKYEMFIEDIYQYLKNIKFQDYLIKQKMDSIINNIKNISYNSPLDYLNIKLGKMTHLFKYDDKDLINIIKDININNIKNNINQLLKLNYNKTYIIYGNLDFNKISKYVDIKTNIKLQLIKSKNLYPITLKHPNKKEENNLIKLLYNFGNFNPETILILNIISNMIEQYAYNFLRTQHQLGYLVHSGIYFDNNIYYFFIRVVSPKNTKLVQSKIIKCLQGFKKILEKYSNIEINKWKDITKDLLLEKEKSNNELLQKYYYEIVSRNYLFNRNEKLTQYINKVNKKKIIDYFYKIIDKHFFINLVNHFGSH